MGIGFVLLLLGIGLAVSMLVLVVFGSLVGKVIQIKEHLRPPDEGDSEQEDEADVDPSSTEAPEERLT